MHEGSSCSTSLPAFGGVSVLDFGYFHRCVVASHGWFNLYFLDELCCGTSFHMFICHLCIFFGEVSVMVSGLCVLLLNFKGSLYILDGSSLSDVSCTNISSQSMACCLILLMLSFAEVLNCN